MVSNLTPPWGVEDYREMRAKDDRMSSDMFPDTYIDYVLKAEENMAKDKDTCQNCGKEIKVTILRGSGHCSENCRKELAGETARPNAQVDAGLTNILNQPSGEVDPGGIR